MISHPNNSSRYEGPANDTLDDPRVLELAKEYQNEWEVRGRPDRKRYLARYPELAAILEDYFHGIDMLQRGAKALTGAGSGIPRFDPGLNAGDRLGEFELIREIGRGGMGVVYEALQTSLNRRVAVKVLPSTFAADRTRLQRFILEAQAAAAVVHPHIVPVYAFGEERGIPYYAMRLIDGPSLDVLAHRVALPTADKRKDDTSHGEATAGRSTQSQMASAEQPMHPTPQVADRLKELSQRDPAAYHRAIACFGSQVARALDHAHQCGVVHRDVKPANLLLDSLGHIWVTDFGLAQFAEGPSVSRTGSAIGTLRYMSPEQATGDRRVLDHRTDIFSLAATLYELHTGRPAFTAASPAGLLKQITESDPPRPRGVEPTLPPELETVLLKALQKVPGDRYTTAAEFADDVDRFLEGKRISARKPGVWQRATKWTSRHPSMLAAALASLLMIAIASSAAVALVSSERRDTQKAYAKTELAYREAEKAYRTAEASARAERERADEVERRYRRAKELGDLVLRLSEEEIGSESPFQAPRRRLLLAALDIYRELVSIGSDESVRSELDKLLIKIRLLLRELDLKWESEAAVLLFQADVRAELKANAEQSKKIDFFASRSNSGAGGNPVKGLPGTNRPIVAPALSQKDKIDLITCLTQSQRQRLRQIYVQFRGANAFGELDVIEALELTPAQRHQIKVLQGGNTSGPASPPGFTHPGKFNGPLQRPTASEPNPKALEQILELLTAEQRAAWDNLTGLPFPAQK